MKQKMFGNQGFGLVEALAAGAVVSISALGLGTALNQMAKTKSKVQTVSYAMALESSLQSEIQDKTSYEQMAASLAAGNADINAMELTVEVPLDDEIKSIQLGLGRDVYFNRAGEKCESCSGTAGQWAFRVRVEGKRVSASGPPIYAMAYRVDFNPEMAAMASMGSQNNGGGFADGDFKWVIPPGAYLQTSNTCQDQGSDALLVTGINKETGELLCARFPTTTTCAADEVGQGWMVKSAPGVPTEISLKCKKLPVSAACPSLGGGYDYAVQNINKINGVINMDAPSGTCLFTAQKTSSLVTLAAVNVGQHRWTVCPANYHWVGDGANSGCRATLNSKVMGWTKVSCGAPYVSGDEWIPADPGSLSVSGTALADGVECNVVNDPQASGAGFDAQIWAVGRCELNVAETRTF